MRATIPVRLGTDETYDIQLGEGLLAEIPDLVATVCPSPHYAVVTDSSVQSLYAEPLARALGARVRTTLHAFPAGEWNKTRETWADLTDSLLQAHVGRDGAIVAVGGGVAGDLGGFVAATYLRGIRYIQVPTSLLAMVDSSIGGKTGVDTAAGKNLVGAFHQPQIVVADLATLRTLPPPQLAAGMAEALKHGAIADAEYFAAMVTQSSAIFAGDIGALFAVVHRSVGIKAAVTAADPRERGARAVLNFGHTIAHALEAVSGYELLHGEAVALGMLLEAEIGSAMGITDPAAPAQLRRAIEAFRLPLELPSSSTPHALLEVMRRDKKVRDGSVRFALIEGIGTVARAKGREWTIAVPESVIEATLQRAS